MQHAAGGATDVAPIAQSSALRALLVELERLPRGPIAAERLESLLAGSTVDAAALSDFLLFTPERYTRNLIRRSERFELLVLCWSAGAASPIHDHGASTCAVKVVRGSLRVDDYTLVDAAPQAGAVNLRACGTRRIDEATVDMPSSGREIHRMSTFGSAAISLHVYAPPLDRCLIFDPERHTCSTVDNRYDTRPPPAGVTTPLPRMR